MRRLYRPWLKQFEDYPGACDGRLPAGDGGLYTFSALATAELENLIHMIQPNRRERLETGLAVGQSTVASSCIREEGYPADPKDRGETGSCGSAGYGREGLYQSPEHMDVLHQAEAKLRERTKGTE